MYWVSISQSMAWRQAITWTNAGSWLIGPLGTTSVKFGSKYERFHSRKCTWMCRQRNGGHSVQWGIKVKYCYPLEKYIWRQPWAHTASHELGARFSLSSALLLFDGSIFYSCLQRMLQWHTVGPPHEIEPWVGEGVLAQFRHIWYMMDNVQILSLYPRYFDPVLMTQL